MLTDQGVPPRAPPMAARGSHCGPSARLRPLRQELRCGPRAGVAMTRRCVGRVVQMEVQVAIVVTRIHPW
jgi:hypothetical protein